MKRSTIGGPLNLSALAALAGTGRAHQDAPPDRETSRVAARELRARGLTVHDIAHALRLSEGAVLDLLGAQAPITRSQQP